MALTCPHLEPLEEALAAAGVTLGEAMPSPYGQPGERWFWCAATFQPDLLRHRLRLADFIDYSEYDGRHAGNDAVFYCPRCRTAIAGPHPAYARAGMICLA